VPIRHIPQQLHEKDEYRLTQDPDSVGLPARIRISCSETIELYQNVNNFNMYVRQEDRKMIADVRLRREECESHNLKQKVKTGLVEEPMTRAFTRGYL
jgi:hypothetical protein